MLKLRSIFVTSLLTGLVITSNFGCGGSDTSTTDAKDVKPDTQVDVPKPDVQPEVAPDVKPDASPDADVRPDADAGPDVPDVKPDADSGPDVPDVKPDADAGDGGEVTPMCPTTPVCVIGAHRCVDNGVEDCGTVAGCPNWIRRTTACTTHQVCNAAGAGTCDCADGCAAAGTFCGTDGRVNTCAVDANGCKFVSGTPVTCEANQSCQGPASAKICDCNANNCTAAGTSCVDGTHKRDCIADGSSKHCLVESTSACPNVQTCQGAANNAMCACPVVVTDLTKAKAGDGCVLGTANICDLTNKDDILHCVTISGTSCNIWQPDTHCGGTADAPIPGMTCGTKAGPASCQCKPQAGATIYVDDGKGSNSPSGIFPTGNAVPPECAYKTLTMGLNTARDVNVAAAATIISSVQALKDASDSVFDAETFPLSVPASVALNTSDATGVFTIVFTAGGNTDPAVSLQSGSAISGFTIQANGNTAATAIGFPSAGSASVSSVSIIKGTTTFAHGVGIGTTATASAATGTLTSVNIDSTSGAAVVINTTSTTTTINGGKISKAGAAGVDVRGGTLRLTDVALEGNATGLMLSSSGNPTVTVIGGSISGSPGAGVTVSNGTLAVTAGATIQGNAGDGLALSGGSTTLTGITVGGTAIAQANKNGVGATGTSVNLTVNGGTTISGNLNDGIVAGPGSILTLVNGSKITKNAANGVSLHGGAGTINGVTIDQNKVGIDVDSANGPTMSIGNASSVTTVTANTGDGFQIHASQLNTANSVNIDTVTITANGMSGVNILGDTGNTFVTIQNSVISGNKATGVVVAEDVSLVLGTKTQTVFRNNSIDHNNQQQANQATKSAGGLLFATKSTLSQFFGNTIFSNTGAQLEFDDTPNVGDTWSITQNSACDALANSIYCYQVGQVGLLIKAGSAAKVDATFVKWQSEMPGSGIDFSADDPTQVIRAPNTDPNRCHMVTAICTP